MSDKYKRDGRSYHPLYGTWSQMLHRCYSKANIRYDRYGQRGILVCERWRNDFFAFVEDMGFPPTKNHTLDRVDGDGNYEPSNCRWATKVDQSRNTVRNVYVELYGETVLYTDALRTLKVNASAIFYHQRRGKTRQEAIDHFAQRRNPFKKEEQLKRDE